MIPAGSAKVTIEDVERHNEPEADGYAPATNTMWSWLNIPPQPDEALFNLFYASALRLDSAHSLCTSAIGECDDRPDEPFILAGARIYRALGYADLMCVPLHRAVRIMKAIPNVEEPFPKELDQILTPYKRFGTHLSISRKGLSETSSRGKTPTRCRFSNSLTSSIPRF